MPTPLPQGSISIDTIGYAYVKNTNHPLARQTGGRKGWVARHRMLIFDQQIATCHHDDCQWCGNMACCHWCNYPIPWRTLLQPAWRYCVNVDHINGIKGDDRLDNLVAACGWCNVSRCWIDTLDAPDEWARVRLEYAHIPPWDRPTLVEWLGPEWGIGSTDLMHAIHQLTEKTT